MRWLADAPSRRELIDKIKQLLLELKAKQAATGAAHLTYCISDPVGPRRFYVGETSDLSRRARQHLANGGRAVSGEDRTFHRQIYKILAAGAVPDFEILDTTQTRAASLVSEAAWARRLRAEGHDLANQWAEHENPGAEAGATPLKRLYAFTPVQLESAGVEVWLKCPNGCVDVEVPISRLKSSAGGSRPFSQIRTRMTCPVCEKSSVLRLVSRSAFAS